MIPFSGKERPGKIIMIMQHCNELVENIYVCEMYMCEKNICIHIFKLEVRVERQDCKSLAQWELPAHSWYFKAKGIDDHLWTKCRQETEGQRPKS